MGYFGIYSSRKLSKIANIELQILFYSFFGFVVFGITRFSGLRIGYKEIIDYLAAKGDSDAPIVFCPTQRLSKRLERTIVFTPQQFPDTKPLNAYYYVHGETLEEVLQLYNGKGLANGLPLLSELAALYDRTGTKKYVGKYMAEYDREIPHNVHVAGQYLMRHYPIRVSRIPLTAPLQFWKMFNSVRSMRMAVAADLEKKINLWQEIY